MADMPRNQLVGNMLRDLERSVGHYSTTFGPSETDGVRMARHSTQTSIFSGSETIAAGE